MLDLDHLESRFIPSLHSDADVLCIFHCSFFWLYSRDTQSFSRISFLIMFFCVLRFASARVAQSEAWSLFFVYKTGLYASAI